MASELYGYALANAYDMLNDGIEYNAWADFITECAKKFSDIKVSEICELACGTGTMACELALRGYSVTASDLSPEMLCAAENKARKAGLDIRFVCQDMRYAKMYSQKDMAICLLDSINYLTKNEDVLKTFESVYSCIKPGGLFIFDTNSKYKFENIYADNSYVLEADGVFCGWENYYNPKTKICNFYLSIFAKERDGRYTRCDEAQREKMYTVRQIKNFAKASGFEFCGAFSDFCFGDADENRDQRIYYVLKKGKENNE